MLNQRLQKLSLETEVSAKFNWVKPRLDKLNQEINRGLPSKMKITNSNS